MNLKYFEIIFPGKIKVKKKNYHRKSGKKLLLMGVITGVQDGPSLKFKSLKISFL